MTRAHTFLIALTLATAAWAGSTPLPPSRPTNLAPSGTAAGRAPPSIAYAPAPEAQSASLFPPSTARADAMDEAVCAAVLAGGKVRASRVEGIAEAGGCGVASPLSVAAFVLANGDDVLLDPPATMRCDLAAALSDWVRDDLAPLAHAAGARLTRIADAASYDCRGRNRQASAKLSEHAFGNALDVRALTLSDGRSFDLAKLAAAPTLRDKVRASACARFATVLGPGADGYHEGHFHLDLAARRNGFRICQWN